MYLQTWTTFFLTNQTGDAINQDFRITQTPGLYKSLSSSSGAPLATGKGSEVSLDPSLLQAKHPQLSQAGSRAEGLQPWSISVAFSGLTPASPYARGPAAEHN